MNHIEASKTYTLICHRTLTGAPHPRNKCFIWEKEGREQGCNGTQFFRLAVMFVKIGERVTLKTWKIVLKPQKGII